MSENNNHIAEHSEYVVYVGHVYGDTRDFYLACLREGMEQGSYAIAVAVRAFQRWRPE